MVGIRSKTPSDDINTSLQVNEEKYNSGPMSSETKRKMMVKENFKKVDENM